AQGYLLSLELAGTIKDVFCNVLCIRNKVPCLFNKTVKSPACLDTWIDLPDLNEEREGLALMNIQGTVMAVGGSIRGELLDIVETWDGEK
ncbi:MAG: hypothetical protein ACK56I_06570, partial [bacterium]